jgi:IS30 family transposase
MRRVAWEKTNPEDFRIAKRLREDGYQFKQIAEALGVNRRTVARALQPEQREKHAAGVRRAREAAKDVAGPNVRTKLVQTWIKHRDFNPKSSY